jgi:hypothetical protein
MTTPRLFRLALGIALAAATSTAFAVEPFKATYLANYMGMQGNGVMTLAPAEGDRWTYSFRIDGSMAELSQRTVFEEHDGQYRPLSGTDRSRVLIKKIDKQASYDWGKGVATWSGDVKEGRAGPVKLRAGDLDGMLVNLALVRDVAAGKPLHYRMVDDGRIKQLDYQVAGKEQVTVGGKAHQATKVVNTDGEKQTVAWIVEGLPVPVRLLQKRDGKNEMDLQLQSVD